MKAAGRILLVSALLFALLNGAIAVALRVRWFLPARLRPMGPEAARLGLERLSTAYPGLSKPQLAELLSERARVNRWEHEAFTDFRETPASGRYIHVTENGYRLVADQGPWPPRADAWNVFCFGGSTAFGDGLPDDQSLPSVLQELLPKHGERRVFVYNFARPGYYSTQERILFEQLLLCGVVPDAVVFVDGLNECFHPVETAAHPRWVSSASERLSALVEETNASETRHALGVLVRALPVTRVGVKLLARFRHGGSLPLPSQEGVAERWLKNRALVEAVAASRRIPVLFVWQPVPLYGYDLAYHLPGGDFARLAPVARTYEALHRIREARPDDFADVLWLADVQRGRRENLYVDDLHYTAKFSRELAALIAARLSGKAP
jgi:hypothetical protein